MLPVTVSIAMFLFLTLRSRARGGARVRARGRPRKGAPKVIDEKKVLRGMKRELGLREERVREFGFFEDGQEEEEVEVQEEEAETGDQFSAAAQARTRCGRLSRSKFASLPLRISTGENPPGGNLDAEKPPVAEVGSEAAETPSLQSRRNFTPPAR